MISSRLIELLYRLLNTIEYDFGCKKYLSNNMPAAFVMSVIFARQTDSIGRKRSRNFDFEIFVSAMSRTIFTPSSTGFSIVVFMKTQFATSVLTAEKGN